MTQGIENIEIYNPIGGLYGVFPVTDKCERSVTLMGDDYVKLAFSLTKQRFQFEAFSYIVYDGKHYFLPERYRPTPQGSNYDYAMTFVSAANMLSKSLFMRYYQVPTEEDPTVFRDIQPEPDINVNADLIDITTILLRSIQGASDRVPVFSNTKTIYAKMIAGMTLDTDDMIDGTELKTFTFESNNIEEVLNNIAEQYKTEWWITESAGTPVNLLKLHICKCEQRTQSDGGGSVLATPTVLSDVFIYKDGEAIPYSSKGLLSVGYAQEWSNIPQRIIPFGSDRNIIRTQALDKLDDKDVYVSYGKRLRLNPNHQVTWQGVQRNGYIVKQKDGTDDFLPVGSFGEVNNPNVNSGIEKTELFDDIYPQGHFLVTKCELSESGMYFIIEGKAIKQNADGTPMKEDGEYVTYTWREMCTPLGEDVFTPGDKKGLGLVPLQNKNQTEDLTIHFESGWLNGREFGVSRNNGVKETEDGVEVQVLSLDIVPDGNEDEALALPNAYFYPQVGDMFAIFNMDMPQGYIDMAEQRLAQATYEKLIEYQNSRPDVKCKSEPTFFSKLSAMLVGKRFAVFSELFGDIVYIDDDPDKGIDEEHSAVFTSRVTAYSHSLTNPASIDFTLASGMVAGRLASIEAMISDTSSELRGLEQRHINLSKRGWHDAEELSQMLESLTTEMMLVGNAKYQFRYTFGIVLDNDNMVISNVKHTKSITVQGGGCLQHTQKPYIDYPNQGLWYVDETEINLYQSNGTPIYDPTKPYYLYAIVNNTGARLTNQDIVLTETEQNGDMYMLLGVLSSEFEDEVSGQKTSYRIFSRTNGYTAIAGGTITTEQIQDANRQLIIDFQSNQPRIIAKRGAQIIGNITFISSDGAETNLATKMNNVDEELAKEIGGENVLFVNNVNRVESAQDPEGVFKYELTYYSGSGNSRQHTYLPAGKYVFSAKNLSYGCDEHEWICQVHLEAINSSGTVKKSIYLHEGDIRDKLIEFTEPCYIALQLEMWTHEEHTQTQGFVSISNMQLQKGTKSTSYQNYMEHLANAIKGTTEINGGLVMLNVLMLKNEQGEVTAGMSGLQGTSLNPENVLLWGGGDYQEALNAADEENEVEYDRGDGTPITTLLKKDGKGKIGVFYIKGDRAVVKTDYGKVEIDDNEGIKCKLPDADETVAVQVTPKDLTNLSDLMNAVPVSGTIHFEDGGTMHTKRVDSQGEEVTQIFVNGESFDDEVYIAADGTCSIKITAWEQQMALPQSAPQGTTVIQHMYAKITDPNGNVTNMTLVNNVSQTYTPTVTGTYTIEYWVRLEFLFNTATECDFSITYDEERDYAKVEWSYTRAKKQTMVAKGGLFTFQGDRSFLYYKDGYGLDCCVGNYRLKITTAGIFVDGLTNRNNAAAGGLYLDGETVKRKPTS